MRILVCLFTYNRSVYLSNTARSVNEFFPWGDRWVIDDGSDDTDQKEVLRQIASWPNWTVKRMERKQREGHGGYPANTQFALQQALKEGYDYLVSLEDDVQFLWHKPDYLDFIKRVFDQCPDAIQIAPYFLRRIKWWPSQLEYIESVGAYRTDRGWSPIAITNLDRIRTNPDFQFICDPAFERLNSAFWLKKNYRVYYQGDPTLAFIPWAQSTTSHGKRWTASDHQDKVRSSKYIFEPLDDRQINLVQNRDPRIAPFQEYLNVNKDHRPFWGQKGQSMARFYYLCHEIVSKELKAGVSPGRIPLCASWKDSVLPPCNHVLAQASDTKDASHSRPVLEGIKRWLPQPVKSFNRFLANNLPLHATHYFSYRSLCSKIMKEQKDFLEGRFTRPNTL